MKVAADPGPAPLHRATPSGAPCNPTLPTALPPAEGHLCLSDKAGASGSPSCLYHSILRGINFESLLTADS